VKLAPCFWAMYMIFLLSVVVVTTATFNNETGKWFKRGVTCSSLTSVSLEPPVVSFTMAKPRYVKTRKTNQGFISLSTLFEIYKSFNKIKDQDRMLGDRFSQSVAKILLLGSFPQSISKIFPKRG
jgi:hypothetical protein